MKRTGTILSRSATSNPWPALRRLAQLIPVLLLGFLLPGPAGAAERNGGKVVAFLGDSLTAGLGLDPDQAYPALVQKKIEAAGLPWQVVNAGISGDTTAGGLRRLDWVFRQPIDLIVIALGANDGLRGIPLGLTQDNLKEMIEFIRKRYPKVVIVLAGMQVPANYGPAYTNGFAAIYPTVAKKYKVPLIPFLLEDVGGHPELNQADGMHPTAEGQVKLATNVWTVIEPLLRSASVKPPHQ